MKYANGHNDYFFPYSSTILFRFPQRKGMPPVDITWYDGLDNLPPIPAGYGVSGLDPNIPSTNQGDTPASKLNPGKIIYTKDLVFKGGKPWKHSLHHPRRESQGDGRQVARSAQEPVQPF